MQRLRHPNIVSDHPLPKQPKYAMQTDRMTPRRPSYSCTCSRPCAYVMCPVLVFVPVPVPVHPWPWLWCLLLLLGRVATELDEKGPKLTIRLDYIGTGFCFFFPGNFVGKKQIYYRLLLDYIDHVPVFFLKKSNLEKK